MEAYGSQVTPLLKTLIWYGGPAAIGPDVSFHGRALWRGSLRHWLGEDQRPERRDVVTGASVPAAARARAASGSIRPIPT